MTMNVDEEIGRLKEEITRLGLPQSDGSVSVLSISFLHVFIFLLCFFLSRQFDRHLQKEILQSFLFRVSVSVMQWRRSLLRSQKFRAAFL
jgi:hypothetical protein